MFGAFRAQMVGDARRVGRELLALGHLAVEHAQRVGELAAHAVLAELLLVHALEEFPQGVEIGGPAGWAAQRIEFDGQVGQPQRREVLAQHEQQLGVQQGIGRAHGFDVDLVELAHAALLRPFVAEHGAVGEDLGQALAGPAALGQRPHDPGRGFGPQGERPALAVGKGVHFLLHHVRFLADGAGKEFGAFEDRDAQLPVAVTGKDIPGGGFDPGEDAGFGGEQVGETLDFLYGVHGCESGLGAGGARCC